MPNDVLARAVRAREILDIVYSDETRTIEPHTLGTSTRGRPALSAYQTSGDRPGWRLFDVEKLAILPVLRVRHFEHPRPGYAPGDRRMSLIHMELTDA